MQQRLLSRTPVVDPVADPEDWCDWRQLALGMAALLVQKPRTSQDMLTEVARQLRSPVATLRAQAQHLEQTATAQPAQAAHELAVRMVEQADHVADWVDAILDVQRLRLGKTCLEIRDVDLVELAMHTIEELQTSAPCVDVRLAANHAAFVPVDGPRLRRVMCTLARNAARRAPGTPVEIRIDPGEWTHPSRGTMLVVQPVGLEVDAGSELAAAHESHLDLDLLLAREVARLHGGDLWASSAGGGAVILLLPGGET